MRTPADAEQIIAELRRELAAERATMNKLVDQLARLTDRVTELTALLDRKKRKPAKKPSDPPDPPDPPPDLPPSLADRPRPPPLPEKMTPPKQPQRPTGRKPLPGHLPKGSETHRPTNCRYCGSDDLCIIGEEVTEKLDTSREHFRRREIARKTCRCNGCLRTTTAEMPPMPWERSKYTSAVVAHVVYQKLGLHLPLDRMRRDWELRGISVSISMLVTIMFQAGELLAAIDGEHWKQLLKKDWMHSDGSGLDVIIEGHDGVARGHIDVFTRDDLAVYTFSLSKKGEDFASRLKVFEGILISDAESRLNVTFADGTILEAGCNAHGIRKFQDAKAEQPILAAEGEQFLQAMFLAEEEATRLGLVGAARLAWRQEKIGPIADNFRVWLRQLFPDLLPGTPLCRAVGYYLNHWDALMRFIGHAEIPMHNNASERLFRALDSGRLNWLFAGSVDAAHNLCVLMGLVATCRLQKVDPEAYLAWALDRRGTWRKRFNLPASQLTPAAYKQSLQQTQRQAA